ncbi:MAG TPA: F0F1 ATP synthase subunit alpha, partial [Planctomycetota bacterium]|nr:F0F1 ATP synthase subunit alpha [Planctomycetota bacterium]
MKINPEEITSVLRREIEQYSAVFEVEEEGTILEVGDGIARVYGLAGCMAGEMVEFPNGSFGLALNLEESSV